MVTGIIPRLKYSEYRKLKELWDGQEELLTDLSNVEEIFEPILAGMEEQERNLFLTLPYLDTFIMNLFSKKIKLNAPFKQNHLRRINLEYQYSIYKKYSIAIYRIPLNCYIRTINKSVDLFKVEGGSKTMFRFKSEYSIYTYRELLSNGYNFYEVDVESYNEFFSQRFGGLMRDTPKKFYIYYWNEPHYIAP